MLYDVVIVGGGPGGLSAALALGRARKRVLLCDSGPRRNAAAEHINNFVTRDGTPPEEFRQVARRQLGEYPSVEITGERVEAISGTSGAFQIELKTGNTEARRVLLCTGMIDDPLPIEGFEQLWGHSIFQCPYCHGWESQDLRWGYLVGPEHEQMLLPFALQALGWTNDLVVFTSGNLEAPAQTSSRLRDAGIRLETAPVNRLVAREGRLEAVELAGGTSVLRDVLFTHPPQRQVELVKALGPTLDDHGYVQVDPVRYETSIPGIHAAGDLTTAMQGAIHAAAAATRAAAMINVDLAMEPAAA